MATIGHSVDARTLYILMFGVLALAALVLGMGIVWASWHGKRIRDRVEYALAGHQGHGGSVASSTAVVQGDTGASAFVPMLERAAALGVKWGDGRFGDILLADEDRRLLDMAGYPSYSKARAVFLFVRAVLSLGLPLVALAALPALRIGDGVLSGYLLYAVAGFGLGWMLPKWIVVRRVRQRKQAIMDELPLLVDLLRLLQGVGLSVDQSLHMIQNDFRDVLPVLAYELHIAVEQYARGRTRLQSMARMIDGFDNEDLEAVCRLIAQVDQHGGAVQDPLKRFSDRLRERRRMDLKEKVGKLTVKMTGVMVVTLLPALLIVTAGSGFVALVRALKMVGGAS